MKKVSFGFTLVALLALIAVQLGWATPSVSAAPSTQGPWHHMVQPGENLYRIAMRYNVSQQSIISANNILNPNYIQAYRVLYIPDPGYWPGPYPYPNGSWHYVQPGQTVYSLARWYNTSVWAIVAANPGTVPGPHLVYAWSYIWIPHP